MTQFMRPSLRIVIALNRTVRNGMLEKSTLLTAWRDVDQDTYFMDFIGTVDLAGGASRNSLYVMVPAPSPRVPRRRRMPSSISLRDLAEQRGSSARAMHDELSTSSRQSQCPPHQLRR